MMQKYSSLVGRILIVLIFLISGIGKITDPASAKMYMSSQGMPLVTLFLIGAIVVEIAGAIAVILGYKARLSAVIMFLYMIPVTLIFHNKLSDQIQYIMFLKNIAIMGGLLMIAAFGPGPMSLDARLDKRKKAPCRRWTQETYLSAVFQEG